MNLNKLNRPYIIAEIGCNHNGDTELALKMIAAAKKSGADAVKFQFFTKDNLCTNKYLNDLDSGKIKIENVDQWNSKELKLNNIHDQIDAFTNDEIQLREFRQYAKKIGIDFGCTPVDSDGIKVLENIDVDFIKLASMDADNLQMVRNCINSELPIIISTGMSTLQEIDKIYNLFKSYKYENFALLHCVSIYPPKDDIVNLNFIDTLNALYDCEIGYSDHTLGFEIAIASVVKGVKIIEKHFTLDKNMPGWDHKVSADENDFKILSKGCKKVFDSLGSKYKVLSKEEIEKREKFRRSITLKVDVKAGDVLTEDKFIFKRPGTGISPSEINYALGKKFKNDISKDSTLFFNDLI